MQKLYIYIYICKRVLFLMLTGEVSLPYHHAEEGSRLNSCWWYWKGRRQQMARTTQNKHSVIQLELRRRWNNAGRQQKSSSAAPSVCTREPEEQLHGNTYESRFVVKGLKHTITIFGIKAAPRCGLIKNRLKAQNKPDLHQMLI